MITEMTWFVSGLSVKWNDIYLKNKLWLRRYATLASCSTYCMEALGKAISLGARFIVTASSLSPSSSRQSEYSSDESGSSSNSSSSSSSSSTFDHASSPASTFLKATIASPSCFLQNMMPFLSKLILPDITFFEFEVVTHRDICEKKTVWTYWTPDG